MTLQFDTFVCYAMPDRVVADCICSTFEQRNLRCWIAPRNILKGVTWSEAIIRAINASRSMVVVLSPHADASPHVIREVTYADSLGRPLVFCKIDPFRPAGGLAFFTAGNQCRDAWVPPLEPHVHALVGDVVGLLEGGGTPRVPDEARRPVSGAHHVGEELKRAVPDIQVIETTAPVAERPVAPGDFFSFAGLRYGDPIDKALRIFGQPEAAPTDSPYRFQESHYLRSPEQGPGLELRWWTSSRRIMQIDVRSPKAAEFVRSHTSEDKLRLLGMTRTEIVERLGRPTDARPSTLEYSFSKNLAAGLLTVTCPQSQAHRCSELSVHWFRP